MTGSNLLSPIVNLQIRDGSWFIFMVFHGDIRDS
jgi:hypothetical protein